MTKQHITGWTEIVDLPDWGVTRLRAKIDSGAKSSALHVENLKHMGGRKIRFDIVMSLKNPDRRRTIEASYSRRSHVKSSTGEEKLRYFVKTTLVMGPVEKQIEVSLVCRKNMRYRMLIGRTALDNDFLVDCSDKYLLTASPLKKRKHS